MQLGTVCLALSLAGIAASCALAGTPDRNSSSTSRNQLALLQHDFSEDLAALDWATIGDAYELGVAEDPFISALKRKIGSSIPEREFTRRELMRLGHCTAFPVQNSDPAFLVCAVRDFAVKHGGFPANGVELFPDMRHEEMNALRAGDDIELLGKYLLGINPVTGRFYESFSNPNWSPGGVYLRITDDPQKIAAEFPRYRVPLDPTQPGNGSRQPSAFVEATFYGEAPGSILLEHTYFF